VWKKGSKAHERHQGMKKKKDIKYGWKTEYAGKRGER